jgi:hypothetical protein
MNSTSVGRPVEHYYYFIRECARVRLEKKSTAQHYGSITWLYVQDTNLAVFGAHKKLTMSSGDDHVSPTQLNAHRRSYQLTPIGVQTQYHSDPEHQREVLY